MLTEHCFPGPDRKQLRYQRSSTLGSGAAHAVFTRWGGHGQGDFSALNLGLLVGDHPETVAMNRTLVKEALGCRHLATARQVHGTNIQVVDDLAEDQEIPDCDALVSTTPGIGLLIQQADCQAVLLHDPVRRVVAAAHVGWRGSVVGLPTLLVDFLRLHLGCKPADLHALISPSLGPCCAQFVNFRDELPPELHGYNDGRDYFDFWRITRDQLHEAGVQRPKIETSGICTMCSTDYFSHRRAVREMRPSTGRNGTLIALKR